LEGKSLIERFLESAGGPWIRADRVSIGDKVSIEDVTLDEETFDRPYIVVSGIFDRTGEPVKVRLGVKNVKRIAKTLGTDERKWIGCKIEVIDIEEYPGLGQKGILWKGVPRRPQQGRLGNPGRKPRKPIPDLLDAPGTEPCLETLEWLQTCRTFLEQKIPVPMKEWNSLPDVVRRDLEHFGLVEDRWGYPYLTEKCWKYIKE